MGMNRHKIIKEIVESNDNHINLDLTNFEDSNSFKRFLDRNNLEYQGRVRREIESVIDGEIKTTFTYVWADTRRNIAVSTCANPITGNPGDSESNYEEKGRCRYIAVHTTNPNQLITVATDLITTAKYVKGLNGTESYEADGEFLHSERVEDHALKTKH